MALPSSGPISGSQIGTELIQTAPYSLAKMSVSASFAAPYAMSNFYGYSYKYAISLFALAQASLTIPPVQFYYQIGAGAWTLLITTTVGTGNYSTIGIVNVTPGSSISFAVRNTTPVDVKFGITSASGDFTSKCGERISYLANSSVNATGSYYVNLNVVSNALVTC
jgi:hypothetical protein